MAFYGVQSLPFELCQTHLGFVIPFLSLNVQKHLSENDIFIRLAYNIH